MELTTTSTPTKSADSECDTPPRIIQPVKSLSYTNGPPKKHHSQPPPTVVIYRECLRNHAAGIGGHAVDGCGEFMPAFSDDTTFSLKCAACGCHRNFHRREPDGYSYATTTTTTTTTAIHFLEYPSPSPSPPPQPLKQQPPPSSYAPPPMLISLSTAVHGDEWQQPLNNNRMSMPLTPTATRKRSRTKFTQEQKEKMHAFAEKLGWKLQKSDTNMVEKFCNDIGVARGVFKVWMHNNKHCFGKKDTINSSSVENGTVITFHDNNGYNINSSSNNDANKKISSNRQLSQTENNGDVYLHDSTNLGSSSST